MFNTVLQSHQFQTRIQEEERRIQLLPAAENPTHAGFQGDKLRTMMKLAPSMTLKELIKMQAVPLCDRIKIMEELVESFVASGTI